MIPLLVLLLTLAISGRMGAALLRLPTRLARWLMAWTIASAQLVGSVQLLSLVHRLDGTWLLGLNVVLTGGIVAWARRRPEMQVPRRDPPRCARWRLDRTFALAAGVVLAVWIAVSIASAPAADIYHFTMPIFWAQRGSILPAPVYDPRLNGVVFTSEALAFPGFLFAKTAVFLQLLAAVGGIGVLWITGALSRQLGASPAAAAGVATLLLAVGPFANSVLGGKAEVTLSAMWFAGSVYLLLEAHLRRAQRTSLLGCAVFCFAMAAGTKNVLLLHLPVLLGCGWVLFGARFRFGEAKTMLLWGIAGLLVSGVVWSYVSNRLWYGDWRGHPFLRETLSHEMDAGAVWTRWVRGAVTALLDPIWLPVNWQPDFALACRRVVSALGAREHLAEDAGFYGFEPAQIRPGQGLGWVGLLVILPSVGLMLSRALRVRGGRRFRRRAIAVMAIAGIGSCLVFFTVLRWQSIGLFRLMLSCVVVLAPLGAALLERSLTRWLVLAIVAGSVALYSVSGLVFLLRRSEPFAASPFGRLLQRLQHDRSAELEFRWGDGSVQRVAIRENYTRREVYREALARMSQPVVIGVIGGYNAEVFGLFGERFQNRVISLSDCRGSILRPERSVEFIAIEDYPTDRAHLAIGSGFEPWLEVYEGETLRWSCMKRCDHPPR